MPYKKRYSSQKPATSYMNKAGKALSTATAALALARHLKGFINVEKHRHILTTAATSITNAGSMSVLTLISQGDAAADRQGNSILSKGISSKLYFLKGAATTTSTCIRVIYFIDTQQVGDGAPAVTDVLETASFTAPLNRVQIGRFKILKQYFVNLQPEGTEGTLKDNFIKLNHHIRFNGSLSTDIQKGGIYRLAISNHSSNYPTVQGDEILQFYDN